ncbi:MAG: type II secretion system protein [Vicinamibacterales bacterium]
MAALLVAMAVMGVLMSVAMPSWRQMMQREREEELIFRGEQYARAVALFQRKYAGASPPTIDLLLEQKFLRKRYKDPMTPDGEFQIVCQNTQAGGRGAAGNGPTAPRPGEQATTPATGRVQTAPSGTQCLGGIAGVVSKSSATSIRLYNGRSSYSEWQYRYVDAGGQAGAAGATGAGGGRGGNNPAGPGGSGRGAGGAGGGVPAGGGLRGGTPGEVVPE